MKKIWLFLLWLCTVFLVWNFTRGYLSWNTDNSIVNNIQNSGYNVEISFIITITYALCLLGIVVLKLPQKIKSKILKIYYQRCWSLWHNFSEKYPVIIQYIPPEWINSAEAWLLLHRWGKSIDTLSLLYKWESEKLVSINVSTKQENKIGNVIVIKKLMDINNSSKEYEQIIFNKLFENDNIKEIYKGEVISKTLCTRELNEYWINKWRLQKKDSLEILLDCFVYIPITLFLWAITLLLTISPFLLLAFYILISLPIFDILNQILNFNVQYVWGFFFLCLMFLSYFLSSSIYKNFLLVTMELSRATILKETENWAKLISHILWYREFLKSCSENELKALIKEDPQYIDKALPYAIVFWLENKITSFGNELINDYFVEKLIQELSES